jgi:DNA transposition AAA+ family ATPase
VHLIFLEDRQLRRSEIESLRKATELPLEFSLVGNARVSVDLASVTAKEQLPTIRSILSQVV